MGAEVGGGLRSRRAFRMFIRGMVTAIDLSSRVRWEWVRFARVVFDLSFPLRR